MKINKIIIFGTILIIFIWTIPSISSLSINAKSLNKNKPLKGVNGGTTCVVCTVLVTMTEELSIVYNQTVEQSLINLCNYLPKGIFRTACTQILRDYGQVIINGQVDLKNFSLIYIFEIKLNKTTDCILKKMLMLSVML